MISQMDDPRQVELDCVSSIFPEIQKDSLNPFTVRLELPVHPIDYIDVFFSPLSNNPPATSTSTTNGGPKITSAKTNVESCKLSYLPPLHICITLPEGYPDTLPPEIDLHMNPKWLSNADLNNLKVKAQNIWVQSGGSESVYGIIDFLMQASENSFGYAEKDRILEVPQEMKISLLDFDLNESQVIFNKKTFNCGICLEPKKGVLCHQMSECKHIFCVKCLQDFYVKAIETGDITSVRCLSPECMKKSKEAQKNLKTKRVFNTLHPNELLQIHLSQDIITRFINLRYKKILDLDKDTIYCPRKWCGGAARSSSHCKILEINESVLDEQMDSESGNVEVSSAEKSLLSVCEDCLFAFCNRCFQSWHGDFTICLPKAPRELNEEDKASLEYLRSHTTACPTCKAPSQKSYGCNHMICFKCATHFCYLCSSWLSAANPYAHYNTTSTYCYNRLWELEDGNIENMEIGHLRGNEDIDQNNIPLIQQMENFAVRTAEVEVAPVVTDDNDEPPIYTEQVQRESSLILRINYISQQAQSKLTPELDENFHERLNQTKLKPNQRHPPPHRARIGNQAQIRGRVNQRQVDEQMAHNIWVQRFVELALNDEEDQIDWNSDDERDPTVWDIPIR